MTVDRDQISDARDCMDDCLDRESGCRQEARTDMRFAMGDQWDEPWMGAEDRKRMRQPVMTVNQLPQYLNQVRNDIRQNRPAIRVRPVDSGADIKTSSIIAGIIRHAEHRGSAELARDVAADHGVMHGLGWYRVRMDYPDAMSFDQEPLYQGFDEPHNVYHSDFRRIDGADLTAVVIVSDVDRETLAGEYRGADLTSFNSADSSTESDDDCVRIAEYYCLEERGDTLLLLADGQTMLETDARKAYAAGIPLAAVVRERETRVKQVYWRKLSGAEELESRVLPGSVIPCFPVIGNFLYIDGKITRFGLIRAARDPQRYYNWLKTAEVEYLGNAPKAPWVGDARSFAPYQEFWRNANTVNYAYLPLAGTDDSGQPIPQPQRIPPAPIPSGLIQAEMGATDDIKKSVGMYSAAIGARGSATSGKQELAQIREADTGTFHYSDNLAKTVAREGEMWMTWVPHYYNQRQIARIIGADGDAQSVRVSPALPQATTRVNTASGIQEVYNLGAGRYDVAVDSGPSYTTKRMEAAAMLTEMARGDPTLMQKAGDIIVRNYDIPGADELSKRLKMFLPPQVLQAEQNQAAGNPEQLQQAMAQIQASQQQLQQRAQMLDDIAKKVEAEGSQAEKASTEARAERQRLADEMKLLEARRVNIEQSLELHAMRVEAELRAAAEKADQAPDLSEARNLVAEIDRARAEIQAEARDLEHRRRTAELSTELHFIKTAQRHAPEPDAQTPVSADSKASTTESTESDAGDRVSDAREAQDIADIKAALAELLKREAQRREPGIDEIRKLIHAETEATRKAVEKAVMDARTVRIDPEYDDSGNIVGGQATDVRGRSRSVEIADLRGDQE